MNRTLLLRLLSVSVAAFAVAGGGDTTAWAHGSPPPVTETSTYTVRVGDSLDGIARKLGVGFAELLAANSLTESSVIHPGDTLTVPAGARNIPATPPAAPTTPDKIVAVRRVL